MGLKDEINEALANYNSLEYIQKDQILIGILEVDEGDKYHVMIQPRNYPDSFPLVWEIGERIPRKVDRHIFETTGNCCFTTKAKEDILLKTSISSILKFISIIVIPFFQNNSYYEIHKKYKYGEHSHDAISSIIETYKDILGIDNIFLLREIISNRVAKNIKIRPNDLCFCDSNVKIKNCDEHYTAFKNFIKIKESTLKFDLSLIDTFLMKLHINSQRSFGNNWI
jgi:hypothetical protein